MVTDKIFMETLCIPKINGQLSNQKGRYILYKYYPHLQGLNIANSSSKTSFDVDLLVGIDFCYNFITSNVKRGQIGEPVAIESKLGLVLTGPLKSNFVQRYLGDTHISIINHSIKHLMKLVILIFLHLFATLSQ